MFIQYQEESYKSRDLRQLKNAIKEEIYQASQNPATPTGLFFYERNRIIAKIADKFRILGEAYRSIPQGELILETCNLHREISYGPRLSYSVGRLGGATMKSRIVDHSVDLGFMGVVRATSWIDVEKQLNNLEIFYKGLDDLLKNYLDLGASALVKLNFVLKTDRDRSQSR